MRETSTQRAATTSQSPLFPVSAGVLLGVGLGGFFDGIVLHQILQWHHILSSAGFPPDSVHNLQVNTLADGLFHASTYLFVLWGLVKLWRAARKPHFRWSSGLLFASMLVGFGLFNCVEGLVNHQLLGIHHVNETVPPAQWIYWDVGFLLWGLAMLVAGWLLLRHFSLKTDAMALGKQAEPLPGFTVSARPTARGPDDLHPGDEAPAGAPGTGEALCRDCGGSGGAAVAPCATCGGTGKVTVAVAGG